MPTLEQVRAKIARNMPTNGVAKRNTPLEWTRLGANLLQSTCERYTVSRAQSVETGPDGKRAWLYQAWRAAPKPQPKNQTVMPVALGSCLPSADAAKALCQSDATQQECST